MERMPEDSSETEIGKLRTRVRKLERWQRLFKHRMLPIGAVAGLLGINAAWLLQQSCELDKNYHQLKTEFDSLRDDFNTNLKARTDKAVQDAGSKLLEQYGSRIVEEEVLSPTAFEGQHTATAGDIAASKTLKPKYSASTMLVAGTAFGTKDMARIGFSVTVNGASWGQAHTDINESTHIHHMCSLLLHSLPPSTEGSYFIEITPLKDSQLNSDDTFLVWLLK
jgi:hypothetical protein